MKTEKFNYDLPEHLIAQYPLKNRVDSKLLACIAGIEHKNFKDVLSYMDQGLSHIHISEPTRQEAIA